MIGVLLLLCLLPLAYAAVRFGAGNVGLWCHFKLTHSKPDLPVLYVPKERREGMRKDLYGDGGAKPAASSTVDDRAASNLLDSKTEQGASIGLEVEKV